MTSINLIPTEAAAIREARRRSRRWRIRLTLAAVAALVLYGGLVRLAAVRRAEVGRLNRTYALLHEHIQAAERILGERDRLDRQVEAISRVRGRRTASWYLDCLEEALPSGSYLNTLQLGEERPAGPVGVPESHEDKAPEPKLRISGRAPGHQEVGRIIRELIAANCFTDVNLVSVAEPTVEGREVDFEIACGPVERNQ